MKPRSRTLKTLRGNIRPTPATLHLEITMLLHQERRLRAEWDMLQQRSNELQSTITSTRDRITTLRALSDSMDPGSPEETRRRSSLPGQPPTADSQASDSAPERKTIPQAMCIEY